MAGRKFSLRKLYNLECLLLYVRERYTFINIFIKEKKVQGKHTNVISTGSHCVPSLVPPSLLLVVLCQEESSLNLKTVSCGPERV